MNCFVKRLSANEKYKSKLVDFSGLCEAGRVLRFDIFKLVDENDFRIKNFAMLRKDIQRIGFNMKDGIKSMEYDSGPEDYAGIVIFDVSKKSKQDVFVYIFQKLVFPGLNIDLTKREEFEITRRIISDPILAPQCVFIPQRDTLGYKVDLLIRVRPKSLGFDIDVPDIALEIDENNHKDRNKENEEGRQNALVAFYHVIRIPVSRGIRKKSRYGGKKDTR